MAVEIELNLNQTLEPVQSIDQVVEGVIKVKRTEIGGSTHARYSLVDTNKKVRRLDPFDVLGEPVDLGQFTSCEDESPRVMVRRTRVPAERGFRIAVTAIELI